MVGDRWTKINGRDIGTRWIEGTLSLIKKKQKCKKERKRAYTLFYEVVKEEYTRIVLNVVKVGKHLFKRSMFGLFFHFELF